MASTPYEPPAQDWPTPVGTTEVSHDSGVAGDQSATDAAKSEANRLKESAAQTGSDLTETVKGEAAEVAADVKDQAKQFADEARVQLNDHAGSQMQRAAGNLRSLSDELSGMAQQSEQSGMGAQLARQGGDLAGRAAGYLEDREPGDLVTDLRDFARRRPGAFLLGAALTGVLAGRVTRGVQKAHSNDTSDTDVSTAGSDDVLPAERVPSQPPPPGYATGWTGATS